MLQKWAAIAAIGLSSLIALSSDAQPVHSPPIIRSERMSDPGHGRWWSWLQTEYRLGKGREYDRLLRDILSDARHLKPSQAAARAREVITWAKSHRADGLEPVLLAYWDCAAGARTAFVKDLATVRFKAQPLPHMYVRIGACQYLQDRKIRGEAVRAVFKGLTVVGSEELLTSNLRKLLQNPTMTSGLCNLAPRINQCGQPTAEDLIRQAACKEFGVPGGPGILETMCQEAHYQNAPAPASSAPTPRYPFDPSLAPTGTGPDGTCGPKTLTDALRSACQMSAGASAGGAAAGDPLDAFSQAECDAGTPAEALQIENVTDLMNQCYGTPDEQTTDKLADEGASWADHVITHAIAHITDHVLELEPPYSVGTVVTVKLIIETAEHIWGDIFKPLSEGVVQQAFGTSTGTTSSRGTSASDTSSSSSGSGSASSSSSSGTSTTSDSNSSSSSSSSTSTTSDSNSSSSSSSSTSTTSGSNPPSSSSTTSSGGSPSAPSSGTASARGGDLGGGLPFDPNNAACQKLASMGVLLGRKDDATYQSIFGKKGPSRNPVTFPSDSSPRKPDTGGSCLAPDDASGASHCESAYECEGFSALDPSTCQCSTNININTAIAKLTANPHCVSTFCAEGEVPSGPACACSASAKPPQGSPPVPPVQNEVMATIRQLVANQFNSSGKVAIPTVYSVANDGRPLAVPQRGEPPAPLR
jgi:hypothetical protein